ncbi:hypothetical protein [Paenisporosarcina sp. NPDC076898]|uniref:hypothetical protein n=1 Tax=unclassified Paenisporosarcina TaxID=2642018 RepID=UPI003D075FE6
MIDKYLVSNCLFIIDEFNEKYKDIKTKEQLKIIADTEYSEADMVVRLGFPFRHMATFNMQGKSKELGNDIVVKSKDFNIEVKLQKNYKSGNASSNSANWNALEKDFQWLSSEIINGKQGNRAFVLGWFNAVDRFSQIVQLGTGKGSKPLIDRNKMDYFPFLNKTGELTKDITYMYPSAYTVREVNISGYANGTMKCMFLGSQDDKFHIAIYW